MTSTLSSRGADLASGPNMRDKASLILTNPWDPKTNPDGLVNLGTAENHLMLDDVAEFVKSQNVTFDPFDFDYGEGPWGSVRLRTAMSNFINSHFNPRIPTKPEQMTITNGCSPLFHMLGLTLGDAGDGVLLTMPSYVAFASDFGIVAKMKPIHVPFSSTDQFAPSCIPFYEAAYTRAVAQGLRPRVLVLCNPHNPLGRCYPRSTLIELLRWCSTHKLHVVADEIYAMSVYAETDTADTSVPVSPFTSVLSLDLEGLIGKEYVHVAYGMSKDFASGGMRVGCLWTANKALQRAVSAVSNFHWSGSLDCIVACTLLENPEFLASFLGTSRKRLAEANALAKELLDAEGIRYAEGSNAGFFLWVDLSPWLRDEDGEDEWEREEKLMGRMIEEKVFLTRGGMQASEKGGWFRFVFARKEEVLREGMKRLKRALGPKEQEEKLNLVIVMNS